jgi:hypothetical protein
MKLHHLLVALCILTLVSCQKEVEVNLNSGKAELHFTNVVGTQPVSFNTPYFTHQGEDFTVTKFKYYVSNIILVDSAGQNHKIPDSYYLVDQENPASLSISLQTDEARYKGIQFLIGVDSVRNVSGAQTGALDPAMDMFWTWNTGYIMAKMEGTSSRSTLPNNRLEYHIGGFQGTEKALRTVYLPFGQNYSITSGKALSINIRADILTWFDGAFNLPLSVYPTCTSPGLLASHYADNYANMFSITSLQAQ